jgi:hypothetical protein
VNVCVHWLGWIRMSCCSYKHHLALHLASCSSFQLFKGNWQLQDNSYSSVHHCRVGREWFPLVPYIIDPTE